jgi:hypothetical protein
MLKETFNVDVILSFLYFISKVTEQIFLLFCIGGLHANFRNNFDFKYLQTSMTPTFYKALVTFYNSSYK